MNFRHAVYRLQNAVFALRRYVPGPVRQRLKPLYRRWWQRAAQQRLAAALDRTTPAAAPAGYTIVCFSGIDWELRFQRPQQLLSRLAAGHRVYYLRTDFAPGSRAAPLEPLASNVHGLRLPGPAALNIYAAPPTPEQVDAWLPALAELAEAEALGEVVGLVHAPFWAPLALAAREQWGWRVVYDCLDEHGGFSTNGPALLAAERSLITQADLVLATAELLYEKCAPLARRCLRLPNAADSAHFRHAPGQAPLARLQRPVIGYYGAIAEWLAADWLQAAAQAHPEWSFVLIGLNSGVDLRALEKLPNVHLLGERPYAELPGYLHGFDVAVIPFKLNDLTRATNPVKFYEYLSASKPVVATALPELLPHRELFYPATDSASFVRQLETAVAEQDPDLAAARADFAASNTWEARVAQFDEAVRALYGRVAIVIVSYQNLDYLKLCLESIWARTDYPNYQVVVVDNASGPEVVDYLCAEQARNPRLAVLYNAENVGFARANNQGLAAAGACEYVVLLNNDTVVTTGWLSRLLRHLQRDPWLGMVGPVTNWASNLAKIAIDYSDLEELEAFAARYTRARLGQLQPSQTLDMFCVALPKAAVDAVGPLDEGFGLGLFEDDDYALRLRRAGYRLAIASDAYVHHWGWASFGKLDQAQYDRIFEENRRYFEHKWGQRWQRPPLNLTVRPPPLPPGKT